MPLEQARETVAITLFPAGPGISSALSATTDVNDYFTYTLYTIVGDSN